MVFSSAAFLFFFLPLVLAISLVVRRFSVQGFYGSLLLFSLGFYYWSSGYFVFLMLLSIFMSFYGARWLEKSTNPKPILIAVIVLQVALLSYFKYTYFFASAFKGFIPAGTLDSFSKIILPVGISFYTFQSISYIVDVYRKQIPAERNMIRYGAYLSFFPQLIAGPIVRYQDVESDFETPNRSLSCFNEGVIRFSHGLLKKLLIADNVALLADTIFAYQQDLNFLTAWVGALAYTVQIYFDFSGYSDMAIGLGLMFGIRFKENFNHPYTSSSITEFWRRWHISLSSWFRDYIYIPLGGSRVKNAYIYRNLFFVFLLTGLWHGAGWTFVLWGLWHGLWLSVERLFFTEKARLNGKTYMRFVYMLPLIVVGWVLFRSQNLSDFGTFIKAMFSFKGMSLHPQILANYNMITLGIMILGLLSFFVSRQKSFGTLVQEKVSSPSYFYAFSCYAILALFTSVLLCLSSNYSPFLYFQF